MQSSIKSIKFYVDVPSIKRGGAGARDRVEREVKPTYVAVGEAVGDATIERLEVVTTPGPQATVEIHQWTTNGDSKVFIYQLADILGRIEITR
ncbi:hypothetical protein [Stutzerimonas stutzeri]|uniref:hypothetical protein n=1 Tax=Stutzerimonas stutzeri TaxID=316 RepID=UPI0030B15FAF